MKRGRVLDLGRREYGEVWRLQQELVAQRQAGAIEDTLVLVEHPDVITLGRRLSAPANVLAPGDIPIFEIERGGDVTYHGPGQLVGYPILALDGDERDLHAYLRALEEGLIGVCAELGLAAGRNPGWTGVWTGGAATGAAAGVSTGATAGVSTGATGGTSTGAAGGTSTGATGGAARKLASIGIAVRRWVTMHGFALNVATDLSRFAAINPCGLDAAVMTSLTRELGRAVTLDEVKPLAVARLGAALRRSWAPA